MAPISEMGYLGMNATDEYPVPNRYVGLAENFYLEGRAYKMRPGIVQAGSQIVDNKPIQAVGHYQELDGTYHTFAVCNAELYEYTWATDSWASVGMVAAGITISASAQVDWAVSRGRLILTDGTTKPVMYDPSGPTYTSLTNAPISGGVEIYYDKVFFYDLPGANSNVFEWSDEADPVNGYTGSNQDWEFAQTDTGSVTAMIGMNEKMPVFKEDSIALLRGAAEDEFKTDAVREGVSETEGTPGRFNHVVVDGDVFYLSKEGPRFLSQGYRRIQLDLDEDGVNILGPHWAEFDRSEMGNSIVFRDKARNHVIWLASLSGATTKYEGLLYCVEEGAWSRITFANTYDFKCASSVENVEGDELAMIGDADGNVYIYGGTSTYDTYTARIRSRQYGIEMGMMQKRLAQVDWLFDITSSTFAAKTRVFLDGDTTADSLTERGFNYQGTGKRRYRRGFNIVGWTVGWELVVSSADGQCELHQTLVQMTTTGAHPSRG
jgi:hypothetical protein